MYFATSSTDFNFVPDYIDRSTCAYDFEREIERVIYNTSNGNCDDILVKLQYLLSVIRNMLPIKE